MDIATPWPRGRWDFAKGRVKGWGMETFGRPLGDWQGAVLPPMGCVAEG
jgi:hypothetical protein